MINKELRDFKGIWIPKEIWLSTNLSIQEKVFLVEIDSLDNDNHCIATNKHFSNFFGLSMSRCSEVIKSLERKKYIQIDYLRGKNGAIEKRIIKVVDKPNKVVGMSNKVFDKQNEGIRNVEEGYSEKAQGNNTCVSNTKVSNTNTDISEISFFVNNFKSICVSLPQPKKITESRKKAIRSRMKDYSKEEVLEVFKNIEHSDFLTGKNRGSSWKANFDWILKPSNFIKVLEGNYKQTNPYSRNQDFGNDEEWDRVEEKMKEEARNAKLL